MRRFHPLKEFHHDPIAMPSPNGFNTSQALSRFPRLPTGTGVAGNLCRESALTREGPDASPPLVLLLHFCGEGDNTPQAVDMADVVNLALDVLPGLRGSSSSSSGGEHGRGSNVQSISGDPQRRETEKGINGTVGRLYGFVLFPFLHHFTHVVQLMFQPCPLESSLVRSITL